MNKFTIALLQILPGKTMQENLRKGLHACQKAKDLGADLALFPEMWQIGYDSHNMKINYALDPNDDFIRQFCNEAKKLPMAIALTYLGKGASKPTNSMILIDKTGTIILEYAKVHICSFEPEGSECALEAGNSFKVASLKYAGGMVKIGAMICFDREFPESARSLMHKGAEIILVPNSCSLACDPELGDVRIAQLRGRAFENMIGIGMTNYPAPKNDGHSCAFGPEGKVLVMASEEEGVYTATFDLNHIRKWQKHEVWGAKSLRPECYNK